MARTTTSNQPRTEEAGSRRSAAGLVDAHGRDGEKKLYEVVADRLTAMIADGRLNAGDRLPPERKLMEMLAVGRPAIREALLVLQRAGLVSVGNGRRPIVTRPSAATILTGAALPVQQLLGEPSSLADFFSARTFFEMALARHAALHAGSDDMRALKLAVEESAAAVGDRTRYERADLAFHRVLFAMPGNPLFIAVHQAFDAWLIERWRRLDRPTERDVASHEGHQAIYEAILMRDPAEAEAAMEQHLSLAWAFWQTRLPAAAP
ncbi:FCD domain-containing protein [Consotaella salsifontis]|uniref:Transcriptional regulator, GntR family n=1 Tax=Consotaella salsifontis TaxID=1365950 RepID=A0A1T4TA07_9HYPH|nr:FCD domain-containing protein [Consotaella salsifontis]SKA37410.1 transcriptional regulator, GntR family [Consotaella salsifontis]